MGEYSITQITEKRIDEVSGMLAQEVVSAIKKGLPATALAVVEDKTVVGALGGVVDTDTFEIISVYVTPGSRRAGAGTALVSKLFELADEAELMVRAEYTPIDAEGRTIAPFLKAMGFSQEKLIFPIYCFQTAKKIRFDSRTLPGSMARVMTFEQAGEKLLSEVLARRREEDGMLGEIDLFKKLVDKKLSYIAEEKGELKACLLAERVSDGLIELTPVWGMESDVRNMTLMLAFALDEIRASCPEDTNVMITTLDPDTMSIAEELLGSYAMTTLGFIRTNFAQI